MVETVLTMNEAMKYCDHVGCVYPVDGESYYINSNVQVELESIECSDGFFFARVFDEFLRSIRVPNFSSVTLDALFRKEHGYDGYDGEDSEWEDFEWEEE